MTRGFTTLKFLTMFLMLFSCNQQAGSSIEERRNEIIAIHDEVMPHMGELKGLKTEILNEIQEMSEEDAAANEEKIRELNMLANDLEHAFEGMFVWMRQFQSSYDQMEEKEVDLYLTQQKEMVEKVNEDIKNALSSAKKELNK